jgi:hypothetical protein
LHAWEWEAFGKKRRQELSVACDTQIKKAAAVPGRHHIVCAWLLPLPQNLSLTCGVIMLAVTVTALDLPSSWLIFEIILGDIAFLPLVLILTVILPRFYKMNKKNTPPLRYGLLWCKTKTEMLM